MSKPIPDYDRPLSSMTLAEKVAELDRLSNVNIGGGNPVLLYSAVALFVLAAIMVVVILLPCRG